MRDISDLMNNDIEKKVRGGQKQLDQVKFAVDGLVVEGGEEGFGWPSKSVDPLK